jgi:hypothetical protein
MTNDWLDEWHWPDDLSAQRWLILGEDLQAIGVAAARRGATVTALPMDDEQPLPQTDVIVGQRLFAHIRHPLWWLERVCASTQQAALLHCQPVRLSLETACLSFDDAQGWQANRTALARLARAAGFAHVSVPGKSGDGLWLKAARHWPDFPADVAPTMTIRRAFNPVTGQAIFPRSGRRAFAAFWVEGLPADARRWEVRVSLGGFGTQPLRVTTAPDCGAGFQPAPSVERSTVEQVGNLLHSLNHIMQVNVALPPGLPVGSATVQLWHRERRAIPCEIEVVEGTQW